MFPNKQPTTWNDMVKPERQRACQFTKQNFVQLLCYIFAWVPFTKKEAQSMNI